MDATTTSITTTARDIGAASSDARTDLACQPDIFRAWLEQLDVSDATKRSYRAGIKRYSSWLSERALGALDADSSTVRQYRDDLEAQGLKPGTVNTYLSAVKGFYKWLQGQRVYPDVASDVRRVKTDGTGAKDPLTVGQARRVLDAGRDPAGLSLQQLRDRAIVWLTLYCGLRTCEVARADVGDLRQQSGKAVLWVQGKGRGAKDRCVCVEDAPLSVITDYLSARGRVSAADPLFASCSDRNPGGRLTTRTISGVIKARLRECGLDSDRLTAHSLRHTAITFALLGGATVQEAQGMARHADISTTMVYSHNIDRFEGVPERAVADYIRTGTRKRAA